MFSLSGPLRISWFPGAPLFRHFARNPGLSITLSHISFNSTQGLPHVLRKVDLIQAGLCVYMCSITAFIWLMSVGHSSYQRGKFFSITILGSCWVPLLPLSVPLPPKDILGDWCVRNGEKKWWISAHSLRVRRIASLPLSLLLVSSPCLHTVPPCGFQTLWRTDGETPEEMKIVDWHFGFQSLPVSLLMFHFLVHTFCLGSLAAFSVRDRIKSVSPILPSTRSESI